MGISGVARERQSAEYIHSSIAKQSKMQKLHKFTGFPNLYYPFLVKFKVSPSSSAEIPFTEGPRGCRHLYGECQKQNPRGTLVLVPKMRNSSGNDVIVRVIKIRSMDFWLSFFWIISPFPCSLIELNGSSVIGIKTESCFTVSNGGASIAH